MLNAQSETLANLVHEKLKDTLKHTAYDLISLMDTYGLPAEDVVDASKKAIE